MSSAGDTRGLRIVLVGATGALGEEVRAALEQSSVPVESLVPVASEESIGSDIEFRGRTIFVESELPSLRGVDVLVLCTPAAVALELIREALRAEVSCIDCSGALAGSAEVPVVMCERSSLPELTAPVVGIPSGVALGWTRTLAALAEGAQLERVVGSVLQPAAHAGRRGIETLSAETIALLSQSEPPQPETFAVPVAFDCVPMTGAGATEEGGATAFEARLSADVRRLLDRSLEIAVTSVQVPTFVGEGSMLAVQTREPLTVDDALALLEKGAGLELWGAGQGAPSTRDTAGRDQVLVGRVRRDPSHERGLLLWIATDGLRLVASEVVRLAETRLRLN